MLRDTTIRKVDSSTQALSRQFTWATPRTFLTLQRDARDAQNASLDHMLPHCLVLSCRADMEDLGLRCQSSTQLQVLFGEPWLVHIRHVKLKGTIPFDR